MFAFYLSRQIKPALRIPHAMMLTIVTSALAPSVQAAPVLEFDFGRVAECRDVTHLELVEENEGRRKSNSDETDSGLSIGADEKVIEMNLRVSVQLLSGNVRDVREIRIEISDCDGRMRVHGFAPATLLECVHGKNIEWTKTTETSKAIGASLGGEAPLPVGDVVAQLTPSVSGSLGKREVVTEKQQRIAPKHLVIASGTVDQEHGVFFKLHPSPQTSLEGLHEFTVRFTVPRNWRGDALRVSCQATGQQKILWMKQHKVWAHSIAPVAIYLAGDAKARRAAEQYVGQR